MTNDPVERARLAWIGARYRFEKLVKEEPSDEDYRKAKADMEQAKRVYEQLASRYAGR